MELVTCEKYYEKVKERFPGLTYGQIDRIVKHGLLSYYMVNAYGGDVLFKHPKYTMYTGRLFKNKLSFYKYWRLKWKIKLRIKYYRNKTKFDGYYYFGMNEDEFKNYQSQFKKKVGKRRTKIKLDNVFMYKILDEAVLDHSKKYFFKIAYPEDCGFIMNKKEYVARDIQYILKRNKDNSIEPVSYEQTNSNKYVKRRIK